MGKNLIIQKRGKGTSTYRAPSHRFKGNTAHPKYTAAIINGEILDLINCPGHTAPLIQLKFEDGQKILTIAPEGIKVGDQIQSGDDAPIKVGNVVPLKNIPEGTSIYNIEGFPGDGGKFVKSSGTTAKVLAKIGDDVVVKLPSRKEKHFKGNCRACIGIIAGSGRTEKPFLKAGNRYYAMKARNKMYPSVSGTSMNAVAHPFGGSSSASKGRPTVTRRGAPAGRKVGSIAPSRTGRKKR